MKEISINDFEDGRPCQRHRNSLRMPASYRHQLLMDEWEVSMTQIMKAAMEIKNVQEDRSKTVKSALRQQRSREALQSALRKIGKLLKRNNARSQWKRRKQELSTVTSIKNLKECCNRSIDTEDSAESWSQESSDKECLYGNESDEETDYF